MQSRLLSTLRTSSNSSLLESNEAVPLADSSTTLSADRDPPATASHSHESQRPTAHNRLLLQLLAGHSLTDDDDGGGFSVTEAGNHGASVTSVLTCLADSAVMTTQASRVMASHANQCGSATMQNSWASTGSELSADLDNVNVMDLFNAPAPATDHNTGCCIGKSSEDVEEQLLMSQLEQAIMNSELTLEDLDRLLAISASTTSVAVTALSTSTMSTLTNGQSQQHLGLLSGLSCFSMCILQ